MSNGQRMMSALERSGRVHKRQLCAPTPTAHHVADETHAIAEVRTSGL